MKECILCGGKSFHLFHKEFRYSEKCEAIQCKDCGLVKQRDIESQQDYENFYKESYIKKYYKGEKSDFKKRFNIHVKLQEKRLKLSEPYLNRDVCCLEIGSGLGYFLYKIKDKVKCVMGLELNDREVKWAQEKGIPTINKSIFEPSAVNEESIDVVFLFQVLEHTCDPISFLGQIKKKLVQSGLMIIEVPNLMNPLVSLYKISAFKNFWFQKPHLYYFTCETLKKVIEKAGFTVEKIIYFQEISFINHINWMLTGKPMKNRKISVEPIVPISNISGNDKMAIKEINGLFKEFNEQYIKLIEKLGFGDMIFAVARNK